MRSGAKPTRTKRKTKRNSHRSARRDAPGAVCFGDVVTWRVGAAQGFGACAGHALRWEIKSKSAAALLRSAAAGEFAGLPMNRATIRLIGGCG